jgi:hypothetical protein
VDITKSIQTKKSDMKFEELVKKDTTGELRTYLRKAAKVEQIQNMVGPARVVTFHMSGYQLSDNGLVGFSGMVRYETMTEEQLDRFISKLKIWKVIPLLRFFM